MPPFLGSHASLLIVVVACITGCAGNSTPQDAGQQMEANFKQVMATLHKVTAEQASPEEQGGQYSDNLDRYVKHLDSLSDEELMKLIPQYIKNAHLIAEEAKRIEHKAFWLAAVGSQADRAIHMAFDKRVGDLSSKLPASN